MQNTLETDKKNYFVDTIWHKGFQFVLEMLFGDIIRVSNC